MGFSYDGLKKLFPSEPFDPSYRLTQSSSRDPESSPLIPASERPGASEEDFTAACDKERNKVIEFYKEQEKEIETAFATILTEVRTLEDRELEDVIEEEEEDLEDDDQTTPRPPPSPQAAMKPRPSGIFRKLSAFQSRMGGSDVRRDEADLLEAALTPAVQREQSRNRSHSTAGRRNRLLSTPNGGHRKLGSSDYSDRRLSTSSASSGGQGSNGYMTYRGHLGLVPMDKNLTDSIFSSGSINPFGNPPRLNGGEGEASFGQDAEGYINYIWTANSDYGKVLRIGFKKRIAQIWLDGNSLRGYAELNLTAFEKILKK